MSDERPIYVLHVRPLRDDSDPRGVRRLRSLLKVALRRFGLKCTACQRSTATSTTDEADEATIDTETSR